ncbi:cytochrome b5-like heme/steroid binding domain-containing protein [Podospora fimiseda]|uniref:Cytochrome b5-like heme/steroid binding domain-containing protein n=1 Tax=Podospora fimiseda TaxID=252190 RepID=A0AAN6YL92_9PEZI|nr:cytochrome b5-like heme/steroid binding domain-containing protein [Podospora fimiseda]
MVSIITLTDLSQHKTVQDLWVAVHGNVYDLTSFAADHPGGIDILVECAGTDATEPYDYAGHGDDATEAMVKFKVGPLEGHQVKPKNAAHSIKAATTASGVSSWASGSGILGSQSLLVVIMGVILMLMGLVGKNVSLVDSFLGGILAASSVGSVGLGWGYFKFKETLKHQKEVFEYPAVIKRRKR